MSKVTKCVPVVICVPDMTLPAPHGSLPTIKLGRGGSRDLRKMLSDCMAHETFRNRNPYHYRTRVPRKIQAVALMSNNVEQPWPKLESKTQSVHVLRMNQRLWLAQFCMRSAKIQKRRDAAYRRKMRAA